MASGRHTLDSLRDGARSMECCRHISSLNELSRNMLITGLAFERLERKARDIMTMFRACNDNWNETFHAMLLSVLGGMENRGAMIKLAGRVTNYMIMRENSSIVKLEALLMGGSGLLDVYGDDGYLRLLRQEFKHLAAKYHIKPMTSGEWQLMGIYPHNHPTIRLTQLAACFHNHDFSIQSALMCTTNEAVYDLFNGETSDYWLSNFMPSHNNSVTNYRMGHLKSNILGINLIAPIMYAYYIYTRCDKKLNNAVRLQESIEVEYNRYTRPWSMAGFELHNSFESQAIIQLTKEYCLRHRCKECPLAKMLIL